jgi:hypothetical protein
LGYFCNQTSVDIIPIGFVNYFPQQTSGGLPGANFGNACWGDPSYPGSDGHLYERCVNLQQDIPSCQQAGKKIVLSLGGGSSTYQLTGAAAGTAFATQLWQMYGPYNATYVAAGGIRPLDGGYYNDKTDPNYWIDIDGFDFDIEIQSTGMSSLQDMESKLINLRQRRGIYRHDQAATRTLCHQPMQEVSHHRFTSMRRSRCKHGQHDPSRRIRRTLGSILPPTARTQHPASPMTAG